MTAHAWLELGLYLAVLIALSVPLGRALAALLDDPECAPRRWLAGAEALVYRVCRIDPNEDMTWQRYAKALVVFHVLGTLAVYAILRLQHLLPGNPAQLPAVTPEVSLNTAISFVSNTNWQSYGGETTMSHLSQMLALTVQNFTSAAAGLAVLLALARGFARSKTSGLGNFWADLVRSVLYVLFPLAALFAVWLASQGVVQTLDATLTAHLLDPQTAADGSVVTQQTLSVGPAASQVAIKQLGTNGGGFFNVNSAHPLENPTPLTNFAQAIALLLLPAALCVAFGKLVKDPRQGRALFASMLAIFVPLTIATIAAEQAGTPFLTQLGLDTAATELGPGGNLEGKETRFGIVSSAIWATATTAASNGSVNAMHDSLTPLGGLIPMWLMQLGEVVFGGVGSGLYGLLLYAIVAVFVAGLMVGRTPEYMGKKIEAFEMKMASLAILLPASLVLLFAAVASVLDAGTAPLGNPGIHGFSEILYAFSSAANNNGSAFGGLTASGPFYAITLGVCMWIGRFGVIVPVLALAGSLAKKQSVPESPGTLPTHTPLFVALLVGTIVLIAALTFVPALALGPIVEHLELP